MNSDVPDRTGLEFLPTLSSSLSQQLQEELRLDVPYISADEPHLSGAAVAQMLARFHELDVQGTQSQIADTAGWALTDYDHSTFREKLDRILANAGLLVSSYYPAAHVARAVGNGLEATRIIRRNYPAFQKRDYEFFRALLSEAKSPLVARVHFTTAHYPMSEEMAEKLDMSGHCVLIVGYDRTGFIIHDPWRVSEWGGIYGGPYRHLSFEHLSIYPFVNATADRPSLGVRLQVEIPPVADAVYTDSTIEVRVVVSWPGMAGVLLDIYRLKSVTATITLGGELALATTQAKTIDLADLTPGEAVTASWQVMTGSRTGSFPVQVEVTGVMSAAPVPWERSSVELNAPIREVGSTRICVFERTFLEVFGVM